MGSLSFEVRATAGAARRGVLATPHGVLETPCFFPVGTYGAVRGLSPADLRDLGAQGVLTNTYHLHLRPGEELIRDLGGLHAFMGWDGPILTDSGGYQVYSLDKHCTRDDDGVSFRSPVDGRRVRLTPERCIEIQQALGADLIVTLDEFDPIDPIDDGGDERRARAGMERTLRWAERSRAAHRLDDQLLFGIVQGGGFEALRVESADRTAALGFGAYAIGGLGVGEPPSGRNALIEVVVAALPPAAPRYLMGLGTPDDLVDAVARGVDLFDCVLPTRNGRHGHAFTRGGVRNLRNARFREQRGPIDPTCACSVCARFSCAYLRHLIASGELLGARLVSHHNLAYYMNLLREARDAISAGDFGRWRERYGASSSATDSAA